MSKIDKIIARLKQPSTIKGFIALAGLLGFAVGPDVFGKVSLALPVLIGVLEVFRDEKGD